MKVVGQGDVGLKNGVGPSVVHGLHHVVRERLDRLFQTAEDVGQVALDAVELLGQGFELRLVLVGRGRSGFGSSLRLAGQVVGLVGLGLGVGDGQLQLGVAFAEAVGRFLQSLFQLLAGVLHQGACAFKRGGVQFFARFVERHGMPWVVAEAPAEAEKLEKRDMALGLSRMVQDAVAVIPHGANVTLESPGQSQASIHEAFLSRQDRAISKVLMGQTLTIETDGKNSLAATEAHKDVADDLADADKAMVVDAWNEIAWLFAQVNAGPDVLAPVAAYEEPEDLGKQADLDKKLSEIGVEFLEEHFTEKYGLKPGEFRVRASGDSAAVANFAARGETTLLAEKAQANLDAAIKKMLPQALKASGKFVSQVENAIRKARDLDGLQDALVELLAPAMEPNELEAFLARAMTAAAGYGAVAAYGEGVEDA